MFVKLSDTRKAAAFTVLVLLFGSVARDPDHPAPLCHAAGNRLIVLPLLVGTIVAGSFAFGNLRLWTGSVWPASIGNDRSYFGARASLYREVKGDPKR